MKVFEEYKEFIKSEVDNWSLSDLRKVGYALATYLIANLLIGGLVIFIFKVLFYQ